MDDVKINDIQVVYHNGFNDYVIQKLEKREHNLLMGMLWKMKNKGTNQVYVTFDEIYSFMGGKRVSTKELLSFLDTMMEKLQLMRYQARFDSVSKNEKFGFVNLFTKGIVDPEARVLELEIQQELAFMFNSLEEGNYTSFRFIDSRDAKTITSKALMKHLSQFASTGIFKISADSLRLAIDCPDSYTNSTMNKKLINPAIKELTPYFPGLTVEKTLDKRRIVAYTFKFTPQKKVREWDENKYKKKSSPKKQSKVKEVNPKHANPNFHSEKAQFEAQHADEIAKLYE